MVALFGGHPDLYRWMVEAEHGRWRLVLPAAAMAEAERQLGAGPGLWEPILLTGGILPLPLAPHTAVEVGGWPGTLGCRQAVHEAGALRAVVVTTDPRAYDGLRAALLVV